jgi:hypothetical protein
MMNSRVRNKILLVIGSAALLAAPIASQAKDQVAMDACINAFVNEQLPKNHPLKIVKRDTTNHWHFPRSSLVELSAKGRRTGTNYGSATCLVSAKGEVVAMEIHSERVRYADGAQVKQEPRG